MVGKAVEKTVEKIFDQILNHYTSADFQTEVLHGKKEFFDKTGFLDEDANEFDEKSSQFLDWYIFARPLSNGDLTPIMQARSSDRFQWSEDEKIFIENLNSHRRSLFKFIKVKGSDVYLKDLLENEKIIVKNSNLLFGFDRDSFFEARLVPSGDSYVFMKGIVFHPLEAQKYILKEIKECGKQGHESREPLLNKLQKMRYRLDRYKHVNVDKIYNNERGL